MVPYLRDVDFAQGQKIMGPTIFWKASFRNSINNCNMCTYSVPRTYCNICTGYLAPAHKLHTALIYYPLPHTVLFYLPTLHTHSTQSTTPLPHTPHSPILPPPTLHTQSRRSWRWSGRLWALLSASSSRDCSSARWLGPTLTTPPELR